MSLRIRFFPKPLRNAFGVCLFLHVPLQILALEISYAPPGVFVGEPLAFRVQSSVAGAVSVLKNGEEVERLALVPGQAVEFRTRTREAARFTFTLGDVAHTFELLRPDAEGVLEERDGYLERDGTPVILLPDHRKPPPLDRRWETFDVLRRGIQDTRAAPGRLLWIRSHASPDAAVFVQRLSQSPPEPVSLPRDAAWYDVHSLIRLEGIPLADFLVLELDEADLERGVAPHEWRMKWQFALQRLQHRSGYRDGLLLGPVESPVSAPWIPMMREELQTLARSHGLRFVDRSLPEPLWTERILNRLSQEYRLP